MDTFLLNWSNKWNVSVTFIFITLTVTLGRLLYTCFFKSKFRTNCYMRAWSFASFVKKKKIKCSIQYILFTLECWNVFMTKNLSHFLRCYSSRITINTIQMPRDQLALFILTFDSCPGFIGSLISSDTRTTHRVRFLTMSSKDVLQIHLTSCY